MALPLLAGAGVLASVGAGILGDQDARTRMNRLKEAINLAPLDVNRITSESLAGMETQFPRATALGSQVNTYNASELDKLLESAYPGYGQQRSIFSSNLESQLRGEIPEDVSSAVMRSTAGKALFGGYGGAGLHRTLSARDLGRTSLGIQQQGMQTFMQVPGAFPRAQQIDPTQLMGLSPAQLISLRAQERSAKQSLLAAKAGMPTSSGNWANVLSQLGGAAIGAGIMNMGGGGGTGGGGYTTNLYMQGQPMPSAGGPNFNY